MKKMVFFAFLMQLLTWQIDLAGTTPPDAQRDILEVAQQMRTVENQKKADGFDVLYLTVPRGVFIKKSILDYIAKKFKAKGEASFFDPLYNTSFVNYLGAISSGKSLVAAATPLPFLKKDKKGFLEQLKAFDPASKVLSSNDFNNIDIYLANVGRMDLIADLKKMERDFVQDNFGDQLIFQFFVPKARLSEIAEPLTARLFKLNIDPTKNYRDLGLDIKFYSLMTPEKQKGIQTDLVTIMNEIVDNVTYAIANPPALPARDGDVPPPLPPRDSDVAPPLPPRDTDKPTARVTAAELAMGLKRQRGQAGTATAMGTQYDEEGLLMWTINNMTHAELEVSNRDGKEIMLKPGESKPLSHKSGFDLNYTWWGEEPSQGQSYEVEGNINTRKHVIDFEWNPRTGLVINAHNI